MRSQTILPVLIAGLMALLLASCDKNAPAAGFGLGGGAGNYPPGSVAEFNNRWRYVHFETDSPELTPEGRSIVNGSGGLAPAICELSCHHRGTCRRARDTRI